MTAPRTDREKVALLCHRLAREAEFRARQPFGVWVEHPNRRAFALTFLAPPPRVWADEDDAEWD